MNHKKILFVFLLFLVTIAKSQSNSEAVKNPFSNEFWAEQDKQKHFLGSYVISASTYLVLSKNKNLSRFKKRTIVFATTIFFGLLKETYDATQKNNNFSKEDMMADFAGAAAFQATITIPLNLKKKKDTRLTEQ